MTPIKSQNNHKGHTALDENLTLMVGDTEALFWCPAQQLFMT